ncbi:MAG: hypothetical protein HZB33_13080 [Nitrospirae bacterium]|nr:hypothetical protein [Nitrospirota bacterium]
MDLREKITVMLEAITFAEAGEFGTATELMKRMPQEYKTGTIAADKKSGPDVIFSLSDMEKREVSRDVR